MHDCRRAAAGLWWRTTGLQRLTCCSKATLVSSSGGGDPAQLYKINLTKWNFDLAWLNLLRLTVQSIQSVRNKQLVPITCDLQKPTTMENKTGNWVWTFLNYLTNSSKKVCLLSCPVTGSVGRMWTFFILNAILYFSFFFFMISLKKNIFTF